MFRTGHGGSGTRGRSEASLLSRAPLDRANTDLSIADLFKWAASA
jgi:hypothetical protein